MTLRAAFYKGTRPGLLAGGFNRLGRYLNSGPYSHTELVLDGVSWSSSFEDGGVRRKQINFAPARWDFIDVPRVYEPRVRDWYLAHEGAPYDLWGNVRFFFGVARESTDKWFCSESNMAALGVSRPWEYGPNDMAAWMLDNIMAGYWAVPWPQGLSIVNDPRHAVFKEYRNG